MTGTTFMTANRSLAIFTVGLMCVSLAACNRDSAQPVASPAGDAPDWSGWWIIVDGPTTGQMVSRYADLYSPEARAKLDATYAPDANIPDNGEYCRPMAFIGNNGGRLDAVEFLFTPGRLTITNESGLLRRIDLDGRPLPENPEETNGGTSVGRWEGDTLVIETVGLNHTAQFPSMRPGHPTIGKGARITERFRLNEQQEIEVDSVLIAPELLTGPLEVKRRYAREEGHVVRDHDICALDDRSIDPATGLQRFDLTPPADLPPPPPQPE